MAALFVMMHVIACNLLSVDGKAHMWKARNDVCDTQDMREESTNVENKK
jgi:hypothetical protein